MCEERDRLPRDRLVRMHCGLLTLTSHEVTGRVLYVNSDRGAPPLLVRARAVTIRPEEREVASIRAAARAADAGRTRHLEEAAVARAKMEMELVEAGWRLDSSITVSMQSGNFEIISDPFPTPHARAPRILLVDDDSESLATLGATDGVEIVHVEDGWSALEQLVDGDFDLALCALRVGDWSGAKLFRMVTRQRPEMAARMVFLARESAISLASPSSALGRVLPRPIERAAVSAPLEQWRESSR